MVVVALQRGVPATLEALVAAALVKSRVAEAAGAAGAVAAREGPGYLADAAAMKVAVRLAGAVGAVAAREGPGSLADSAAVKVASGAVRLGVVVRAVATVEMTVAARTGAKAAMGAMGAAEAAEAVAMAVAMEDKVYRRNRNQTHPMMHIRWQAPHMTCTAHHDNCPRNTAGSHAHLLCRTCLRGRLAHSLHHINLPVIDVCSHNNCRRGSAEGKGRL